VWWSSYWVLLFIYREHKPSILFSLSILWTLTIHHFSTWINKTKQKSSFSTSLSSQHVFLCVGVSSCPHFGGICFCLFIFFPCFSFVVNNCVWIEGLFKNLQVFALTLMLRVEKKGRKKTRLSEAWNVLGDYIGPCAYGKHKGKLLLPDWWEADKMLGFGTVWLGLKPIKECKRPQLTLWFRWFIIVVLKWIIFLFNLKMLLHALRPWGGQRYPKVCHCHQSRFSASTKGLGRYSVDALHTDPLHRNKVPHAIREVK